jgi:hypothetical protein
MVTRVDRMNAIQEKTRRNNGAPWWSQAVFGAEPRRNGHWAEEPWEDETPLSLARRLEQDPRVIGRALHWLFIKGGMVVVLFLGLAVLGLVGGFLVGR